MRSKYARLDGIEFLQRLKADGRCCSIILLSGAGTRIMHTVQKILSGGALNVIGTIPKPAGRIALRELLDAWHPAAWLAPSASMSSVNANAEELRAANVGHQWVLHYQPQVDLTTGKTASMEALVRWNHPERGLVYPDHFITAAEACGEIDALTDWVVREAINQRSLWGEEGLDIKMAINISMTSLLAPEFSERISALVRNAGALPQDVTLEITESQLLSSAKAPLENLVRLRLKGFALSIDDFGTGHSSLLQLRDVPFTELKVDRGFVHGARHNQIIRPILEGSLGIAKRMGLKVVAEGVETQSDWELLRELGCECVQGYFISRPMPPEQLWEWLNLWQIRSAQLLEL